jgi:hypothetical protein
LIGRGSPAEAGGTSGDPVEVDVNIAAVGLAP